MAIRLTERDMAILYELLVARYLTTLQILALFWQEGASVRGMLYACQRRLLKLVKQRLIRRIEVPVRRRESSKPYIYTLDKAGAEILISELGIEPKDVEWKPRSAEASYPFLEHLIATNDLKIALALACRRQNVVLASWAYEKELKSEGMKDYVTLENAQGKTQQAAVVPDAYFALQVGSRPGHGNRIGHFFCEIDLGSVTIAPTVWEKRGWSRKVRALKAYYNSGKFQERYGAKAFRVLCVTTGEERMQHLKATTEKEKGGQMFWFSTFDALTPETILSEPVWLTAGDGTPVAILG